MKLIFLFRPNFFCACPAQFIVFHSIAVLFSDRIRRRYRAIFTENGATSLICSNSYIANNAITVEIHQPKWFKLLLDYIFINVQTKICEITFLWTCKRVLGIAKSYGNDQIFIHFWTEVYREEKNCISGYFCMPLILMCLFSNYFRLVSGII
jgi:hypothetical protein